MFEVIVLCQRALDANLVISLLHFLHAGDVKTGLHLTDN